MVREVTQQAENEVCKMLGGGEASAFARLRTKYHKGLDKPLTKILYRVFFFILIYVGISLIFLAFGYVADYLVQKQWLDFNLVMQIAGVISEPIVALGLVGIPLLISMVRIFYFSPAAYEDFNEFIFGPYREKWPSGIEKRDVLNWTGDDYRNYIDRYHRLQEIVEKRFARRSFRLMLPAFFLLFTALVFSSIAENAGPGPGDIFQATKTGIIIFADSMLKTVGLDYLEPFGFQLSGAEWNSEGTAWIIAQIRSLPFIFLGALVLANKLNMKRLENEHHGWLWNRFRGLK